MIWADTSGHDRLPGGGHHADPAQLERPRAGARRRPLRVGRLPADQGASTRGEPADKGFYATANNYLFPLDYPYPDAQHHTGTDPFRAVAHHRVPALGPLHTVADMVRLQNDDLSLPARSLVPLLRDVPIADAGGGQGAGDAAGLGLRARQELGRRGHLRDVAAASARQHARPAGAGAGPRRLRRPRHEEDHRVAARARRPVRRRPDRRPRPAADVESRAGRGRAHQETRSRHGASGRTARRPITTRSSAIRSAPRSSPTCARSSTSAPRPAAATATR